jgi:hypothetical protein
VLDADGNVQQVRASGHWIMFPKIKGFSQEIRQRYPVQHACMRRGRFDGLVHH